MTTRTVTSAVAEPAGPRERFGWAPLLVLLTGTFMTFLDFFIVNVGLPSIQQELHGGPAAVQLVVAGFGLAFAVGLISGGRLGDLYGRRRTFTVGLALFTLASAACGLAPAAGFLIAARVLQGGAAALMTPQVLAILGTVYTGERRTRAFAAYGMTMGLAAVLGQLIGGSLIALNIADSGWRSIFLINVPVGAVALALVRRQGARVRGPAGLAGPGRHRADHRRPDGRGAAAGRRTPAGLAGLDLAVARRGAGAAGRVRGPPARPGPARRGAARPARAVPGPDLRGRHAERAGVRRRPRIVLLRPGALPARWARAVPAHLRAGLRRGGVGYFAAMLTAERIAARLGRQILAAGAGVMAAACLLLALTAHASTSLALLPGLALAGFGIGMVLVPLTATALANMTAEHAGSASGVLATGLQVGGALMIAVIGVVFFGALGHGGFAHAFAASLVVLAALTAVTAALVQLLPRPAAS